MHVEIGTIDAVIIVASAGANSQRDALNSIAAVDPASEGIPMRQV